MAAGAALLTRSRTTSARVAASATSAAARLCAACNRGTNHEANRSQMVLRRRDGWSPSHSWPRSWLVPRRVVPYGYDSLGTQTAAGRRVGPVALGAHAPRGGKPPKAAVLARRALSGGAAPRW